MQADSQKILLKKLFYLSQMRGSKEACTILGRFAEHIGHLEIKELDIYGELLTENDIDIVNWCINAATIPPEYKQIITKITAL